MRTTLLRLMIAVACIMAAKAACAQDAPPLPVGKWQSPLSVTHTNPADTSSDLYLDLQVAGNGTFRGTWGQYICTAYPGAYNIGIYSCSRSGPPQRASGRLGPGRRGTIELDRLGRSDFTWSSPSAGELAIELPKQWQASEGILYRTRMTRDGKTQPAPGTGTTHARDNGPLLSANALYREFKQDQRAALARYAGKTLVLEGRRGTLIAMSDGGAAIHIAEGFLDRALVLVFPALKEVSGIGEGAQFRFRCTVAHFDYQYVKLETCSIVR